MSKREAEINIPALRAIMSKTGTTQYGLAKKSTVPEGTIATLLAGRRQPSRRVLAALAIALEVDVSAIGFYLPPGTPLRLADLAEYTQSERVEELAA